MRNLARLSAYAARQQAWADWEYVAALARAAGREDLVRRCQPAQFASAREVDRSIAAVRSQFGWPPVWQLRESAERAAGGPGDRS